MVYERFAWFGLDLNACELLDHLWLFHTSRSMGSNLQRQKSYEERRRSNPLMVSKQVVVGNLLGLELADALG